MERVPRRAKRCIACGETGLYKRFVHTEWRKWCLQCPNCHHAALYAPANKPIKNDFKTFKPRADAYVSLIKSADIRSILEIGTPNDFYFLSRIHSEMPAVKTFGFDIFEKKDVPEFVTMIDCVAGKKVDLVYAVHVLEHVHNAPKMLLDIDMAAKAAIIEVPGEPESKKDEYGAGRRTMRHYQFFNTKSIMAMIERLGLKGYKICDSTPIKGRCILISKNIF